MTAFQLYFQLKSCLLNLPPEKTFFVSEGIFLESVYFFCPYLNWYLKNVQANQLQTSDETEIKHLEELELKFNIRQKTQQKIILQTLDLLAFLLLELGRPDLTMFLMENEELNGNWVWKKKKEKCNYVNEKFTLRSCKHVLRYSKRAVLFLV
ncbi:hypothetical protein HMI56_001007 [Coelomomyces lativittatus]|nr:hypothetical protein HMI56_001007 [Coelomomyces lativittatus]